MGKRKMLLRQLNATRKALKKNPVNPRLPKISQSAKAAAERALGVEDQ